MEKNDVARFRTAADRGEAEIVEKKSRFIACVFPVESEEEAQSMIESIRKKHHSARHNCYAYQIGTKNEIQKASDDGEPSGTAGKPILEVLTGENVKNTLIVVTRYFGGILLGTGGLVRAYGKSAKAGLENAGITEKVLCQKIRITADYTLLGKIQYEVGKRNMITEDTVYTDKAELTVLSEYAEADGFIKAVTEVTAAAAMCKKEEIVYI
ncbi:MAG: YigZ family protein [Firmicutes bacterium]|nr:YigZ family protein [Bacillota bacterium]